MPTNDTDLARHGLMIVLIGLLAGFCWTFALLGEVALSPIPIVFADSFPGAANDWRIMHLGCLLNGIMALAISAVLPKFEVSVRAQQRVVICVALAIWGNTVFYSANLFAPNRSLSFGDNALGEASIAGGIGYFTALIGAAALIYAVVVLILSKPKGS